MFLVSASVQSYQLGFAQIRNLSNRTAGCEDKIQISYFDDGSAQISFSDVTASRTRELPFYRCQLSGEIVVPIGTSLAFGQFIDVLFTTLTSKPGDQAGGRLRASFDEGEYSSLAMNRANDDFGLVPLLLKTSLPTLKACEEETVFSFNLTVEAMINYRLDRPSDVSSRLETIRLPALTLTQEHCFDSSSDITVDER
jgi:hypothetical protein